MFLNQTVHGIDGVLVDSFALISVKHSMLLELYNY